MKDRSLGKRIALAFAAVAIGIVVWIILGQVFPAPELGDKILFTAAGLGVMIYLTYRWCGKTIALVVAVVTITWVIWAMVTAFMS